MPSQVERLKLALATRYQVQHELGQGGMAAVYHAHDPRHDRSVALKVLNPELTAALGPERFLREITLTARLDHPHILPLLDSGEAEGFLYYVMPYVDGESLRDRLNRETQLPLDDALQIASEVADALGYAHSRGVVHRDIKPENILLSAGHARVADFGVARAVEAAGGETLTSVTAAGTVVGTPLYMSPEQAMGDQALDARADIYSLGCVLFEMLAGEPPFTGGTMQSVIARKLAMQAPSIRSLRSTIPEPVDQVVSRALERTPADRFSTARQMYEALGAAGVGAGKPMAARLGVTAAACVVGVLPFDCLSAVAEDEYLSDGLSEEIIHTLSRATGIRVVPRASSFALKGQRLDPRALSARLGVSHLVEGSLRRAGDRIRVTAQLVSVEQGLLWSDRYDRTVQDVFAIQDEIATAIGARLEQLVGASMAPRSGVERVQKADAYEKYLRARHHWNRRTPASLARSVDLLRETIGEEPGFVLAHSALADAYATIGLYGLARPSDVFPSAIRAAETALALDPAHAPALATRACVAALYEWDWQAAERGFRRATAADPHYATAHQWYAMNLLLPLSRFPEARESLAQARLLDPLSLAVAVSGAAIEYYERHYEAALDACRAALELDEHFGMAYYFLGLAAEHAGQPAEAVAALERAVELSGSQAECRAALGHALVGAGRRAEARAVAEELAAGGEEQYVSPVLRAQLEVGLGNPAGALALLREAREVRAADLVWAGLRPHFDPVRHDSQFVELLTGIGLDAAPLSA